MKEGLQKINTMVSGKTKSPSPSPSTGGNEGETVIVVMDANRSKVSVDAVCWALKNVVRPNDTVVVLGILCDLGRSKTSCFPFHVGIGNAGICMFFLFFLLLLTYPITCVGYEPILNSNSNSMSLNFYDN